MYTVQQGYTEESYKSLNLMRLENTIQLATKYGIFVTEWGTSQSSGGGGMYEKESDVWLAFLDEHNISWCNWSISDAPESSALFKPRTDPIGKYRHKEQQFPKESEEVT